MIIGLVFIPNLFAKDLPVARDWKVSFSPRVTSDGPAYSLINIGNFGYWQKDDAESAHTPGGSSGGIYPRGTAGAIYLDGVLIGGYTGGNLLHVSGTIYANGLVSGYIGEDGNMVTGGD